MSFVTVLKKLFGDKSTRDLKAIQPILAKIKEQIPVVEKLDNDGLRARINEVRADIAAATAADNEAIAKLRGEVEALPFDQRQPLWDQIDAHEKKILDIIEDKLNEHLPVVFATMRETAHRFATNDIIEVTATQFDRDLAGQGREFVAIEGDKAYWKNRWMAGGNEVKWDMTHYEVQLIGGIVLHQGKIAEMATGEGKTLVATLPVFLRSLSGRGVHVVTVNDYLSKRDSEWMGPLYMFHGASVDCIDKHQPNTLERRRAYECDITYGTNNEFGFDYLRDNMAMAPDDLVQRKHYYAIVDEVDSVLIDDARTPLIISGPVPRGDDQLFDQYKANVEKVVRAQQRLVTGILAEAKTKLASEDKEVKKEGALLLFRAFKGLPKNSALIRFLSQEGMKNILLETEAHYLQDNAREMPIVTDPLYFVIDEKNRSVELTDKGIDELTGSSQDPQFFVLPDIASQLSDLEHISDPAERQEKKDELMANYAVKSERVHTVTQLLKAYTLFMRDQEYVVDDNKVKIVDEQTGRIMEGRRYSDGLHQAIEAKEGVKVEAATQTFATITLQNYFRMYHKLAGMTGTAETEAGELWDIYKLDVVTIPTNRPIARIDMNDRVYRTKKEKYKAVIAEIVKMVEAGRPVLVGTTSVEISELLSRMLTMQKIEHQVLNAKLHQREAEVVALAGRKGCVTIATNMAGRGTDIKLSPEVREAGGLAIIGTERHESRRVDRQLRGRAGRQGDPGSSVFFVSFEDTVMRLFASERVVKMLDRLGFKEGEMIEDRMVTKSIETAQKKVENNNFGIRKRLVEYDDVMNAQRNGVYGKRQNALRGERIGMDIANIVYELAGDIAGGSYSSYEDFSQEVYKTLSMEVPFSEYDFSRMSTEEMTDRLSDSAMELLARRKEQIAHAAMPYIKDFVEVNGASGPVGVPVTDGRRMFNVYEDLQNCYDNECKPLTKAWEKAVLLSSIDHAWQEQLREMDELRHSVQNAAYEQKDPLVIYKIEAFELWKKMLWDMNAKVVGTLMRGRLAAPDYEEAKKAREAQEAARAAEVATQRARSYNPYAGYSTTRETYEGENAQREAAKNATYSSGPKKAQPAKAQTKVGRNDPCPCGSGKKYKNCCGKNQ